MQSARQMEPFHVQSSVLHPAAAAAVREAAVVPVFVEWWPVHLNSRFKAIRLATFTVCCVLPEF